MTIRLLGLTEEERLDFEQATGLRTERLFEVIQSQVMAQVEPMVQTSIREVQEVVGPHGSVSRLQAGGVRITREGVRVFNDGVYKTTIDNEGNLFVGSDITDPDNTSMSVFVIDQIYNQEQMGFGDVLLGSNSDDFANIQYDASEGRLNFRGGQTTKVYIDTDGSVVAGSGGVTINEDGIVFENDSGNIFFKDSTGAYDATHGVKISMEGSDGLQIINRGAGDPLGLYITLTDASTPYVQWYETPSEANTAQLEINAGNTSTRVLIGNDIILRANKDGTETVFNERSNDIDFRIESAAETNAFWLDAGNEVIYFFGTTGATSIITVDDGTDKRLEIGADHYFPTRSSSNPNGFWNEANQDMDFTFEGATDASLVKIDAGNDNVTVGGTSATGHKFAVDGVVKVRDGSDNTAIQLSNVASTATVFNEQGANTDFRVEGDTDTNLLFLDASADKFCIGTTSTLYKLNIAGDVSLSAGSAYRIGTISIMDGWQERSETWTRTGNHTFTVSGDLTAVFRKGVKISYSDSDGVAEYGVVGSSSHAAGTTTVNLIVNSDYAMAASTISDKYISYIENPLSFPQWFNWSVTWTNLTVGSGTVVSKWRATPQLIFYEISFTFGAGSSVGDVSFAPPVTSALGGTRPPAGEIIMLDSGTANYYGAVIQVSSTSFGVRVNNAAGTYTANVVISSTIPMTWASPDELNIKGSYRY